MPRLILASQSPRRAQLLRDAGYTFVQQSPPFADPDQPPEHLPHSLHEAEQYATTLALQKARSQAWHLFLVVGPTVILAADTLCVTCGGTSGGGGELIGKPRDRDDARAMLTSFANGVHAVVTGVALLGVGPEDAGPITFADTAHVSVGELTDALLEPYLTSGGWQGKAGAYNLFDRQADGWPITVQGDRATVVGLPMGKLVERLAYAGIASSA